MMKNRLRAFTVMELVVALLLTAIVVSTAFLAMRMLTAQFGELTIRNREAGAASELEAALHADTRRAAVLRTMADGLVFEASDAPALPVRYEARDSSIVRIDALDHTILFPLLLDSITYTFLGEPVTGEAPADQAVLWCRLGTRPFVFTVVKNYDAGMLMRLTQQTNEWN